MQAAAKYATILFEEAVRINMANEAFSELSTFYEAIYSNTAIAKALATPVEKDKIEQLVARVCLKFKFSSLVSNFVRLIIKMHRLNLLPSIFNEYQRLLDCAGGNKIVQLISAKEMSKKDQGLTYKMLLPYFGENIVVKYDVDPALIGGIVASCNSLVLDASVKGAIDKALSV